MTVLVENVVQFMERACDLYARCKREEFEDWMYVSNLEGGMESPIEQLFWMAMNVMVLRCHCEINQTPDGPGHMPSGVRITPQVQIGRYRVDFLVTFTSLFAEVRTSVVVELDGHAFHDRDKRQRSYEKRRDRDLQHLGHKVAHFTGSDVVADPLKCAWEVLKMLEADTSGSAYDSADPLGIE